MSGDAPSLAPGITNSSWPRSVMSVAGVMGADASSAVTNRLITLFSLLTGAASNRHPERQSTSDYVRVRAVASEEKKRRLKPNEIYKRAFLNQYNLILLAG